MHEHLGRGPAPAARHAPGVAVAVGRRQRQRFARGGIHQDRLARRIQWRRRERSPVEANARAPLEARVDGRQAERVHVVRPGLVEGPEGGDVERESLAEGHLEARLESEADAVGGRGRAVAGLEVLGRGLLPEQLAAWVDALDPDAALEVGPEAPARVEDAPGAEGRLEAGPLQVGGEPRLGRFRRDVGIVGRVHRPELQVHAEEPLARRAPLRDADVPLDGLLEHVAVLAVRRAEAEGSVQLPGGRRRGVRRRKKARSVRCGRRRGLRAGGRHSGGGGVLGADDRRHQAQHDENQSLPGESHSGSFQRQRMIRHT